MPSPIIKPARSVARSHQLGSAVTRHHDYVTVVVDHERGAVVWAHKGKDADTLRAFFEELGPERCAMLEAVTLDLSAAYIKAVTEASPKARLIFDRFHVQRLAHDALDTVRRQQWRAADSDEKQPSRERASRSRRIRGTSPASST